MRENMANYIVDTLTNHRYLIARSENNNNIICDPPDGCKFGSVNFNNDIPVMLDDKSTLPEFQPDANWSYNLSSPLHRPYCNKSLYPHNLLRDDNIVEFDIIDTRWNDNSLLWTTLESLIITFNAHASV